MPDLLRYGLIVVNAFLAGWILSQSILEYGRERRKSFSWVWLLLGLNGLLWLIIYLPGALNLGLSSQDLMGTGAIRSTITLSLGSIVAIMMLLRIPRKPC